MVRVTGYYSIPAARGFCMNVRFVPKAVIQNYVMYGLILGTFAQYVEVDPSLHEETP